jgi:hypothetical protein
MKLQRLFFRMIGLASLIGVVSLAGFLPAAAQAVPPAGVVAFVGVDEQGAAGVYVLDLGSGQVGRVDTLVSAEAHLAWQPGEGGMLAFPLADGGYGLLRSLRGCFESDGLCEDLIEVYPAFLVTDLAWVPDGSALVLLTDAGLKLSPPRGRPAEIRDLGPVCDQGIAVSNAPLFLLCVSADASGNAQAAVYESSDFTLRYNIGTFPQITAFDVGPDGRSAVGTLETGGDSGFYAPAAGGPARLANYQVHVYDLEFKPDGSQIALAGATSDATGDGTLRDGDPAELFLYDPATGVLAQTTGFTEATALTWSPDGQYLLIITGQQNFSVYSPASGQTASVSAVLPGVKALSPAWSPSQAALPIIPTAIPTQPALPTAVPTLTPAATLTSFPTWTPFPTLTPFPTWTPIPSATPGSPMGEGCVYVYAGNGGLPPVAIGDTAEVTRYGAAVRFRSSAALTAPMIQELTPGTRMTIQNGPYCSQGYRWWQVQLADGRVGFLADSDPGGYWINKVTATVTPSPVVEFINFYADRTTISLGQCVGLHWDVEGIKAVYYQGAGVTGHESRTECPLATTIYTLRVIRMDGTEVLRQIPIIVS